MKIEDDKSRAPAVDSAIKILDLLSNSDYPLTLTEICQYLDIPNSTGHRIISELQAKKMVDLDSTRARAYCLGSQIFKMTSAVYNKQRLIPYFHPIGEILKNEVNLPVILSIPIGRNVVVIAKLEPGLMNTPDMYIGKTMPIHASAAGKAILSMKPQRHLDNYFKHAELDALTATTITDFTTLKEEIMRCRRLGYASAEDEFSENLSAISAPVLNLNNEAIAAISIYNDDYEYLKKHIRDFSRYLIQSTRQLTSRIHHAS